jgi:phage baseplate assembly protein W
MAQVVSATKKRNILWPMRREGKGFVTAPMGLRYASALTHLLRTPRGSLPFSPHFGTRIHLFRTQGFTDDLLRVLQSELIEDIARWIPDIEVVDIAFTADPDDEVLTVRVEWGIPNATEAGSRAPSARFVFGPTNTSITV